MAEVSNVVLVHGAWADGSSWAKVIPQLEKAGLNAVAVQNPLTSLTDDVAATKRAIARLDGQVILVGHSYGGAVISEGGNDPKGLGRGTLAEPHLLERGRPRWPLRGIRAAAASR